MEPILIFHGRGAKLGIASNHGDLTQKYTPTTKAIPAWGKDDGDHIVTRTTVSGKSVVKGDAKKYPDNGSRCPEIQALNSLTANVICSGRKRKIPN